MITVSDKAKEKLLSIKKDNKYDDQYFLRVSVKGGGCSGLTYDLNFDNKAQEGDQEFFDKGFKVVVDMKSFLYLAGTVLEYTDGLNGKGFAFQNPNATRTCGCGESFGV